MQRIPVVFLTRHVNGPRCLVLPYASTRARGLNTVSPVANAACLAADAESERVAVVDWTARGRRLGMVDARKVAAEAAHALEDPVQATNALRGRREVSGRRRDRGGHGGQQDRAQRDSEKKAHGLEPVAHSVAQLVQKREKPAICRLFEVPLRGFEPRFPP